MTLRNNIAVIEDLNKEIQLHCIEVDHRLCSKILLVHKKSIIFLVLTRVEWQHPLGQPMEILELVQMVA